MTSTEPVVDGFTPELMIPAARQDLRIGRRIVDRRGRKRVLAQDPTFNGILHPGYAMSPDMAAMLALLDDTISLDQFASRVANQLGRHLAPKTLMEVVNRFQRYHLLDTSAVRSRRQALANDYAAKSVRTTCAPPDVLYPSDPVELNRALERCFAPALAHVDASPLLRASIHEPIGLVIPHGFLSAAGNTAAYAFAQLAALRVRLPTLYVIVGPNHVAPGPACAAVTDQPFQTPFGRIEVDGSALACLREHAGDVVVSDIVSHWRDHSIEMMLPYLQWLHRRSGADLEDEQGFRILPILLSGRRHQPGMAEPQDHRAVWQHVATAVSHVIAAHGGLVCLIASGDFVHWGALYDFEPFVDSSLETFAAWDRPLLDAIATGDAEGVLDAWRPTNACAGRPLAVVLAALRGSSWIMTQYDVSQLADGGVSFASFVSSPSTEAGWRE